MKPSRDGSDHPSPNNLTQTKRRELTRRGHELRARVAMGRQGLTDAFAAQVDRAMHRCDLLKIRIEAETGDDATRLAKELSARIGAQMIQRVGRVALLYRPVAAGESDE